MAQLRDIRRRIRSIKKTQQVTKAMKMVAAAKLRRAQEAILNARPYANHLRDVITSIVAFEDLPPHPLLQKPDGNTLTLVVLSGEKGLCGGFNINLFKEVESLRQQFHGNLEILSLGKKGTDHFKRRSYNLIESKSLKGRVEPVALAESISDEIIDRFTKRQTQTVAITYTEFRSALSQKVVTEWVLPLEFEKPEDAKINLDYIFHPDPLTILNSLLPRFVKSQIYRSFLESQASEYGARMTAMDNATRNSEELIDKLTLQYNRARQAAITKELIEVVSGAEALET
ncbi:ATP synthase F1 subunit gamma [bacterium]|nr:ATP synthase F1 subunit gamma [candidate division CSSED10-310 bacterium]